MSVPAHSKIIVGSASAQAVCHDTATTPAANACCEILGMVEVGDFAESKQSRVLASSCRLSCVTARVRGLIPFVPLPPRDGSGDPRKRCCAARNPYQGRPFGNLQPTVPVETPPGEGDLAPDPRFSGGVSHSQGSPTKVRFELPVKATKQFGQGR